MDAYDDAKSRAGDRRNVVGFDSTGEPLPVSTKAVEFIGGPANPPAPDPDGDDVRFEVHADADPTTGALILRTVDTITGQPVAQLTIAAYTHVSIRRPDRITSVGRDVTMSPVVPVPHIPRPKDTPTDG